MMKKPNRLLNLSVLLILILAIGCSASPSINVNEKNRGTVSNPTKVTFWNINTNDKRQKHWEESIQRFNESQSRIQIVPYFYEIEAYKNKLSVAMMSGKLPDIFYYWSGEPFKYMVDSQIVADLTEWLENDPELSSRFYRGALHSAQYYDRIYGIPISLNKVMLWYNKELFAKYKLKPPATWDELLHAVAVLREQQVEPIAISGKERWPLLHWFAYLSNRIGGASPFERAAKGADNFTERSFVEAALLFRELIDRKAFMTGFLGLDIAAAEEAFIEGEAAMYLQGDWATEKLLRNPDIGYLPFPSIQQAKQYNDYYGGYSVGWAIARNKNQEASFEVLMHMLSMPEQTLYVEQTGSPSSLQQLEVDPTHMNAAVYEYIKAANETPKTYFRFYDQDLDDSRSQLLLDAIMKIAGSEQITEEEIIHLLQQIE